jgi:hypothetical protein
MGSAIFFALARFGLTLGRLCAGERQIGTDALARLS